MRAIIPAGISLVIFDCDGVLVDSEPIANTVMARAITRLGWSMDGAESMRRFRGLHMDQVHRNVEDYLGQTINPDWIDAFYREVLIDLAAVKPVDGAPDLVRRCLAAGLEICVASQGSHEKMDVTLGAAGLQSLLTGRIFSARDVARPKPAPDLFLHAAKQCGVKPETCLVIEDSLSGVSGARAANMPVIYLCPDAHKGAGPGIDNIQRAERLADIKIERASEPN